MVEDRPEMETPARVRAMLRAYGGATPDGRPLWRLILAQAKRLRVEGVMRTMPKDTHEEWSGGSLEVAVPAPDRVEEGVFHVPRYKFKGWILERWFPASAWGSEEFYDAQRHGADGRTRMMQAAPRAGDYFMLDGPWPTIEAAGDLRVRVREWMRQEIEKPKDWAAYLQGELAEEAYERARLCSEYESEMLAISRSMAGPVLASLSRAAQQFRNQVAIGIGRGEDFQLSAF